MSLVKRKFLRSIHPYFASQSDFSGLVVALAAATTILHDYQVSTWKLNVIKKATDSS